MKIRKSINCVSGSCLGAAAMVAIFSGGCSAASNAEELASGCDEFNQGTSSVDALSIDGDTKAFVSASASLVSIATTSETNVLGACTAIDRDLGVTDTWSAMAPSSGAPDAELKEACSQASSKITAILTANAGAHCALYVTGAHCVVDETKQVMCEQSCTNAENCTPGNITTLCSPAELTGECSGSCDANAYCEGTATASAQCTGSCAGECTGMCDSSPCQGTHCAGVCAGKCDADCKVSASAQVNCGANVTCRGGCSVAYTAPECETTVTPPSCNVSQTCQSSCKASVEVTSTCTPAGADFECSGAALVTTTVSDVVADGGLSADGSLLEASTVDDASAPDATTMAPDASEAGVAEDAAEPDGAMPADLQALVTTIRKNLPAVILMVQGQGTLASNAATDVVATGTALIQNTSGLSGKAVACAGVAAEADTTAEVSLSVTVNASSSVSTSCGGPAKGS